MSRSVQRFTSVDICSDGLTPQNFGFSCLDQKHRKEIPELTFQALALRSDQGLTLERQHSNLFTVANLPLVIKVCRIKPKIRFYSPLTQHRSFFMNQPHIHQKRSSFVRQNDRSKFRNTGKLIPVVFGRVKIP